MFFIVLDEKKAFFGGFSGIEKRFFSGDFHVLKISLQWFQGIIAIVVPNHYNNTSESSQSFPGIIAMIWRNDCIHSILALL